MLMIRRRRRTAVDEQETKQGKTEQMTEHCQRIAKELTKFLSFSFSLSLGSNNSQQEKV